MTTLPPQPMCMPWGKELYAALRSGRPPASLRPMLPHRFIHHLPGRQPFSLGTPASPVDYSYSGTLAYILSEIDTLIVNAPAQLRDSLDQVRGKIALVRHVAALRPGEMTTPNASIKTAMRALARRWISLHEEIEALEKNLENLVRDRAPELMEAHGISTMTVAEMLILVGDNPERIKSEAALAKLCGVCPIPASSGKTNRMRLNRGGNRQANAALYRVTIVRMRDHGPTKAYVAKRTLDGKGKREIIRCLKRYIVREIYRYLCVPHVAIGTA